ncbi:C39 family peptidase [Micromonospora yasonensis]|uniref:C39 family peptidase n=1 Tax=Micromonospora yasonensis TaxID=1128667 RepID=UPI0022307021|nr:C39 family peptidase [Micromonospora yasonensis]MCW3841303.1 C39 family peptidase [Micromonospora yasonensis]
MEEHVKHTLKRQLRRLATERPYQIVAGSAAALVLAGGTGAALTANDDSPVRQEKTAAVAELAPQLGEAAANAQAQAQIAAPASPSASPSASPTATASTAKADPDVTKKAKPKPPSTKVLDYTYQAQYAYWNCGPAAVRNALSASGIETTQDAMVAPLNAGEYGTNSAEDTTRGLNQMVKGSPWRTHMIPGPPSPAQMDQLQADVVKAITDGRGVVANIVGSATDTDGGWHSFPGGHYIAVVGYKNDGRTVRIADSADPSLPAYWITTIDLANWMTTRGYSA